MSKCKIAYKYDKGTKQYLYDILIQQSQLNPGQWCFPPETTDIQLLLKKDNYTICFDQQKQEWYYVIDNRNKTIYLKEDSKQTSKTSNNLLDPVPGQYTLVQPPDKENTYKYNGKKWVYYFVPVTKQQLIDYVLQLKRKVAYGYILLIKDQQQYKFLVDQESSQSNIALQVIAFYGQLDTATVQWKVYQGQQEKPVLLTLTKQQFLQAFAFGKNMVNSAFSLEGKFNNQIKAMTDDQLKDQEYINNFKSEAQLEFSQIPITFEITNII